MTNNQDYAIHWFRRDLRLHDNNALHAALDSSFPVKCIFIFDTLILEGLAPEDPRVAFIYNQLCIIKDTLQGYGSDLKIYHGKPAEIWTSLSESANLKAVYANRDYEPYALNRDDKLKIILSKKDLNFNTYKDHVIFEKEEILTQQGTPYKVYTPYNRAWKDTANFDPGNLDKNKHLTNYKISLENNLLDIANPEGMIALQDLGFKSVQVPNVPTDLKNITVDKYDQIRDIPAKEGTSKLGTALRFGTESIRRIVKMAIRSNETYWDELIWREFFIQILYNFPEVVNEPFHKKYAAIDWRNNEEEFERWCNGETGYSLVDAGMRELNETGFMHNRVRMVTASFLVKHLLIDWRWGEAYFAEKLMDFELASNNGNWQWVAGCGTDAAPYFRIFNPESQQKKFDPDYDYVKKWVNEWGTDDYPDPVVNHKEARERCLNAYKAVV